ncbi:hypothetical protein NG895_17430 [Aeoliella sp. ICT_H6.2]|uniref:Uncharacterized protein n=1 Tax=Aeoliella straminimaris TaxID=2954799 RepID=A0A9X2FCR9_9BACT|nr:hypothetical protein [Aeoliella straminimaris]MCO6045682.1 hypothetical protein [Aeoliella straminimaris]
MQEHRRGEQVRRFFAGVTEYVFQTRLGVVDPPLVDYISELLTRFLRSEDVYAVRSPRGQRLTQVADMLEEAMHRQGPAKRQLHRHIGDFTLFWTGVYPEVADRMQRTGGKDMLLDYRDQGKRNYLIASNIPVEREQAPSEVLQRLSDCFDICTYGLQEVRKAWEEEDGIAGPILLD